VRGKITLLVEANPNDEELAQRALKRHNICGEVVVTRDGVEARDHLFAGGADLGLGVSPLHGDS
jgi:hypothetical protein